jgi:23S rRNA (uridine2552-2'-O)-methyltransferase
MAKDGKSGPGKSGSKGGGKGAGKSPKSAQAAGPSGRSPTVRVKTARRRKSSSNRWLERHLNDPYVHEAQKQGYRSRAAFKLIELDEKAGLIKKNMVVVDLGSAPGGWSQVAVERGADKVVAIDLLEMDPMPGVIFLQMDFMDDDAPEALVAAIGGGADLVLSDMAPNTTGHRATDHLRIMALVEAAYEFAKDVLKPGGAFVSKVFQGGAQNELLAQMKRDFSTVKHVKPPASRKESAEQYLVATGYRGERT